MSVVAAKVILLDAAVKAVKSKLDAIFKLKDEQWTALKTFLSGKDVLALLLKVCMYVQKTFTSIFTRCIGTKCHTLVVLRGGITLALLIN